jgi:hypothetical protein
MVGGFIAATVVALLQFLRARDRRMLLLAAMFAFQAQALAREWYDVWRDAFQAGVCAAGLGLLLALSPRHAHPANPPPAAVAEDEPAKTAPAPAADPGPPPA